MLETKVIRSHVSKFFCVDKLVWSKERSKVQKLSLNSYQNESHSHTNPRPPGLLLRLDQKKNNSDNNENTAPHKQVKFRKSAYSCTDNCSEIRRLTKTECIIQLLKKKS